MGQYLLQKYWGDKANGAGYGPIAPAFQTVDAEAERIARLMRGGFWLMGFFCPPVFVTASYPVDIVGELVN